MSLGQKIVNKIEDFVNREGTKSPENKKFLADSIDEAIAEVNDTYKKILRDKFAGDALIATLSHVKNMVCLGGGDAEQIKGMAEDAYKMADAMLKAREL